ncbi:MAG: hypothetical protein ACKVQR_21805 [Aquabacterium sp.]
MNNDAGGLKSAARTAGAVLVAGAVLAALVWGNRDFAMLGVAVVLGAGLLGFGLAGGGNAAADTGPAMPQAGAAVSGPPAFDSASEAGTAADYARADHAHGLPPLPALAGDVAGALGEARVTGLQGTPVATNKPVPGNVLIYNGTRWGPANVPVAAPPAAAPAAAAATAAKAVGRGAKAFDVAAAGEFEVGTNATGMFVVTERASYGALTAQGASRGERPNLLVVRFRAGEAGIKALASDRFVAALTAVDDPGLLREYRLSLRGPIKAEADGSLSLAVLIEAATLAGEASLRLRFQVLITRYDS